MTENGLSAADIAAITGGRNDGGMFGDNNGWWVIILLLALGGRGFGFGGGGGCGVGTGSVCATPADVNAAVDQQTLISKLDQQTYGLADATFALNNTITNGFATAELSRANMAADSAKCCCETQRLIERGFSDVNNNINAYTRAILDFLTQDKIATLTAENQSLKFAASQQAQSAFFTANQEAQTAELIRRLGRDIPVPAYVVPNPNCCYQYAQPCGCGGNVF